MNPSSVRTANLLTFTALLGVSKCDNCEQMWLTGPDLSFPEKNNLLFGSPWRPSPGWERLRVSRISSPIVLTLRSRM